MEHNRKNPSLPGFDYATNGAYFVTICTDQRRKMLSKVCRDDPCGRPHRTDGSNECPGRPYIQLLPLGKIAESMIPVIENKYNITVDYYVIMPDHIHMILFLTGDFVQGQLISLGSIVGAYKSLVSSQ